MKLASILVIVSGIICFVLESSWTHNQFYATKLLEFTIVSSSLCFVITFGLLDIVNFAMARYQSVNALKYIICFKKY